MIARKSLLATLLLTAVALIGATASAEAATPQWQLSVEAFPASFAAGAAGNASEGPGYRILAKNTGAAATAGTYTITDELPEELTSGGEISAEDGKGNPLTCQASGQTVECTGSEAVDPGEEVKAIIPVDVAANASGKSLLDEARVEGGGASAASAQIKTAVGIPAWRFVATSLPTNFRAGVGHQEIILAAVNLGGASTHGAVTITDVLPADLTVTKAKIGPLTPCAIASQTVTCTTNEPIAPGQEALVTITFDVDSNASGSVLNEAQVEGGGALPVVRSQAFAISATPPPFGFLPGDTGFSAPLSDAAGAAATQAGSHPYQLTVELSWPVEKPNSLLSAAGHLRDASVDLPPGEIVNPNSTPVLCTLAQLLSSRAGQQVRTGCPEASQIGSVSASTQGVFESVIQGSVPIYNMVPQPGTPSTFGFNADSLGVFVQITGAVRSDGDYGLTGSSNLILARGPNPVLASRLEFWGDPSSPSHDAMRGECGETVNGSDFCPAKEESKTALLSAPVQCTGQATTTRGRTDDWEEPSVVREASYESADLSGNPVSVNGCNQLAFEPSFEARPTTNLADSPSGLNVDVHQPQNDAPSGLSPAIMKDLKLTLPEGMTVNPSSANGLDACTQTEARVNSLTPASCPDASKLGTVEVTTPLLDHSVSGALYLARPFDNPFGSLLALYLALDDPQTGVVSNLAGRVEADPQSGQLTTVFEQNPQLPIEDVRAHLFTGPRASLRTPPTCATYTSTAQMAPWSAPQTATAHPTDSFAIQADPNGGSCPTSKGELPSAPSFTAGTLAPQAGAYSPFVLKLTRPDDSQELQRIETTLAPGLVAKLAGVPYCPEQDIAKAISREMPNGGILERSDPSCPLASEVGTVDVAAGAGITPLHTQGRAYLAGPYEGAPLSLVVITPAVAGPFDLGAVVVRTALRLDPETAKVTAVSDPLPKILDGIPLDIRQIAIELTRSDFTLNPTSCDPMPITGYLTTTQGALFPLSSPFQVGGCEALAFKPKLALRLKGGTKRGKDPALSAVLTMPPGGANIAGASVTLPHSEFLDQSHIGTVCTRVQFAQDACPAASVYGEASATTPLLSQPLSGPVYLRSSSHKLPDLVIALNGQVDVVLDGRVDSVKGGIRTTFEAVPDAPVTKFTLQMRGGKKGLLINSANLCKLKPKDNRATVLMDAQNGKVHDTSPVVANGCKKAKRHRKKHKRSR
jgi:hypothetical protein